MDLLFDENNRGASSVCGIMLLFLRSLPVLTGVLNALLFFVQARNAEAYPWLVVFTPLTLAASAIAIAWRRRRGLDDVRLMIPAVLALIAGGYGLLLAEGVLALWIIPVVAGYVSYIVLELLFLLTFVSARYPEHGLSHVNITLVPLIFWVTAFTSVGLTVFVNSSQLVPILTMTIVSLLLFYATSHPEAGHGARLRWAWIGGWIGLHIGLLGAVLPVNLIVHGTLAAVIGAFALRVRRYGLLPHVSKRLIVIETIGASVTLIAVLVTAKWV